MHSSFEFKSRKLFHDSCSVRIPDKLRHVLGSSYIHFLLHLMKVKEMDLNLGFMQPFVKVGPYASIQND